MVKIFSFLSGGLDKIDKNYLHLFFFFTQKWLLRMNHPFISFPLSYDKKGLSDVFLYDLGLYILFNFS